jgi:hypothetical protein
MDGDIAKIGSLPKIEPSLSIKQELTRSPLEPRGGLATSNMLGFKVCNFALRAA